MAQHSLDDIYEGLQLFKNYIHANFPFKSTIFVGTLNPTEGSGVQANPNTFYAQLNGHSELIKVWVKVGHENTSWSGLAGILDAPFDGKSKARKDGEWVDIQDAGIKTLTAGSSNVTIDDSDPENLIITVDGSGSGSNNPPRPIDLTPKHLTGNPVTYTPDENDFSNVIFLSGTGTHTITLEPIVHTGLKEIHIILKSGDLEIECTNGATINDLSNSVTASDPYSAITIMLEDGSDNFVVYGRLD